MRDKNKLITLFGLVPVVAVVLVSLSMILVAMVIINNYFHNQMHQELQKIKYETIYQSKKNIKSVYGLINNINNVVINSYRREIKTAVEIGDNIIYNIYQKNSSLPKKEIIAKVKDVLNNLRFYNDKSGYFFIYDMKANLLMLPINHKLEGKNFWDYKDIKNKFILKEFINKLKTNPNGVFDKWHYYKPGTNLIQEKLGYAKEFKPLNIFVGSAIYKDNIDKEIYKRIRQFISKLSVYMQSQNLLILNEKGDVIYSSNRRLFRTNQFEKYKKIIQLAKNNGEQLEKYNIHSKLAIFNYYRPMKLVILQEIDLAKLSKKLEIQKNTIHNIIVLITKKFLLATFIFVIIILAITIYLSNLIKKIFYRYDETLNKEKEKAELAAKAKSEFLANMSHEIRTPLNAMFGFIQILQDKDLDKESAKYLNIIEKSGKNLLTIINDILDFSKIDSGKFKIEYIEFNPKEEIEVVHQLFASKASEKDILLEIKEKNLKYNIYSDPTRLKQIISNLLSNAIKFTYEHKKIILTISYNDKKEELFVKIKDEGIGIPKEKLAHIFEAFSQADTSTTRKYGGTGLGLTISYKLVQLLGGVLGVKSKIEKGSEFYFTIPAKKGSLAQKTEHKKEKIIDKKFNYHILVVEDNAANQMFMKVILKKMGLTFDMANNGKIAVEKFKSNKYDFILMDENMPEMNGIEATKKIREIEKSEHLRHITIIALTANALDGDKERFILAGMDYYLAKPLDIEKLKAIFIKTYNV